MKTAMWLVIFASACVAALLLAPFALVLAAAGERKGVVRL